MSIKQIEALVGSALRARVLHWFYVEAARGVTIHGRQLARNVGVSSGSMHNVLKALEKGQLIIREESSRGPVYRAPYEDVRLQPLFALLRQDSELVGKLKAALKPLSQIAYACVFGSFAQGTTTVTSDVDVFVLESERDARQKILSALAKVEDATRCHLDITVLSLEKFKEMLAEGDAFALGVVSGARLVIKGDHEPWV